MKKKSRLHRLIQPDLWFHDRIELTTGIIIGPMRSGKTTTAFYWMARAEEYAKQRGIPFYAYATNNLLHAVEKINKVARNAYVFFFVDDSSGYTNWSVISRHPEYADVYVELAHEMEERGMESGLIFVVFANQYIHMMAPVFRVNAAFLGFKAVMMRKKEEYNEARKMFRRRIRLKLRRQTYELMVLRSLDAKRKTFMVWPDRKVTISRTPLNPPKPSFFYDLRKPSSVRRAERDGYVRALASLIKYFAPDMSAREAARIARKAGFRLNNNVWFKIYGDTEVEELAV